ncbi:MAG: family 43 glycosylhydrolase, partial [Candidatus Solibacter sp.]|nr:family 43 glycosylhydrolase [Candidatus Solibacter sp.]
MVVNRNLQLAAVILMAQWGYASASPVDGARPMLWGDTSATGKPFSKDPSVIRFGGRYLLYYSIRGADPRSADGWMIGIAESHELIQWRRVGQVLPGAAYESKGLAAPFAKVVDGKVHLFYQTYGNGPKDAICHAVSADGLTFERDPSNPIFHPTGNWNSGRAIDGEVVRDGGRWLLYAATRDPQSKVQMVVGAVSNGGFDRESWKMLADQPMLQPELPWEKDCIEAPALIRHGDWLYMFYAGAYNAAPQQIGVARSRDGIGWQRIGAEPFLRNGKPGEWNSSESGHPGIFVDDDGQTYMFYQGTSDKGQTWLLSFVRIGWR